MPSSLSARAGFFFSKVRHDLLLRREKRLLERIGDYQEAISSLKALARSGAAPHSQFGKYNLFLAGACRMQGKVREKLRLPAEDIIPFTRGAYANSIDSYIAAKEKQMALLALRKYLRWEKSEKHARAAKDKVCKAFGNYTIVIPPEDEAIIREVMVRAQARHL